MPFRIPPRRGAPRGGVSGPRCEVSIDFLFYERDAQGFRAASAAAGPPLSPIDTFAPRSPEGPPPPSLPPAPVRPPGQAGMVVDFDILPVQFFPSLHLELRYVEPLPADAPAVLARVAYEEATVRRDIRGSNDKRSPGVLGRGSFGSVMTLDDRLVAKVAYIDPTNMALFAKQIPGTLMDEGVGLLRLRHPNIVDNVRSFMCAAADGERLVVHVMERMTADLTVMSKSITGKSPKIIDGFARVMEHDCLLGLRHMHDRNLLHRDVKPGNILMLEVPRRQPCNVIFKLADMGGMSNNPNQLTTGTYQYLAPECVAPKVQLKASDVWALVVSSWEFRYRRIPLVAYFPDVQNTQQVFSRLNALNSDAAGLFRHVTATLLRIWGAGVNPGDSYIVEQEQRIPTPKPLPAPRWDELLTFHRRVNGIVLDAGFEQMIRATLLRNPSDRPTAAELLRRFAGNRYFSSIAPAPPTGADPAGAPDGVAYFQPPAQTTRPGKQFRSLWYAERGPAGAADAFAQRLVIGNQVAQEEFLVAPGPPELMLPPALSQARQLKPARVLRDRDLVAAGYGYYVFDWEDGNTLLTTPVAIDFAPAYVGNVERFCRDVVALAAGSAVLLPVTEFFLEALGNTCLVHFVLRGRWRHIGSRPHNTVGRLDRLLRALVEFATFFDGPQRQVSDASLLSSVWVSGDAERPVYRVNVMDMYKRTIGALSLDRAMRAVGPVGGLRAPMAYKPAVAWETVSRYSPPAEWRQRWEPLFAADLPWDQVRADEGVARLPYQRGPVADGDNLSQCSPRVRLLAIDSFL